MNRHSLRGGAAAAFGMALFTAVSLGAATQAAAPIYEKALAGIRLNSQAKAVLAKYGNPNEIVIGDVGIRQGPATGGFGGSSSSVGVTGGAPSIPPGFGAPPTGGFSAGGPSSLPPVFGGNRGFSGGGGPPGGFGRGAGAAPPINFPGAPGGQGGEEGVNPGGPGSFGAGSSVGPFGQTSSTISREQEVTWIYNRTFKDKKGNSQLVSYEFLIGPSGEVLQIRVSGYVGGNAKTVRAIGLGSTYQDVIRAYGYPEEHATYGNILVTSYRNRAHVSFQFLNDRVTDSTVTNPGNKVVAITIATIE